MATTPAPHVVIINRNYPPRTGITGESACLLAGYLREHIPVEISIVTVSSSYAGGGSHVEPVGTVHEIPSLYDGKRKILRFATSFLESFRLVWKARRISATHTIVMTDPPFLSFWASVLLSGRRSWVLWSMDLFPDAFVAGKLLSDHNVFYRFFSWIVYRSPPRFIISLGSQQAKYLHDRYRKKIDTAIVPCGVYEPEESRKIPNWKKENSNKIVLGYCGNLGEAHSVNFLKSIIEHLDPRKHHLVLSLYGVHAAGFLQNIPPDQAGVTIVASVTRRELGFVDVHLVSLLKHWAHVCVPSKAVSAVCSKSSFLFYGTQYCDNWHLLGSAGWLIEQTDNLEQLNNHIAKFLKNIDRDMISSKATCVRETAQALHEMVECGLFQVARFVKSAGYEG